MLGLNHTLPIATVTLLVHAAAMAETPASPSANWLPHIYHEVRQLRIELLEIRLEAKQAKIAEVERELSLLKEAQRIAHEVLTELDERLRAQLAPEEREELEGRRAHLVHANRGAPSAKEAELQSHLDRERQQLNRLVETARALGLN